MAEGLEPGQNCWRAEKADRFAVLMENEGYFAALSTALKNAKRSIVVLGWQFDPRTRLDPDSRPGDRQAEIGHQLRKMIKGNPDLDVRLLIWSSPLLIAASQGFFPQRAQRWFRKRIADFRLDQPGPIGACHHQKVVIIDDAVAFVGGGDISTDRWDSTEHLDHDPRRCMPSGVICAPRHEVMCMVDGAAARALGDMARERWFRATWERVEPVQVDTDPWPEDVEPDMTDVMVGIARTEPAHGGRGAVRETQLLHLDCIARAKRLIYLENQYVTSPVIADALARRLAEPDGPEVVVVTHISSPSWFDQLTMDRARSEVLHKLEEADVHDRFTAWAPTTTDGGRIIVHSKVTIVDDEVVRIGSTNLNNRSQGYDTECDLAAFPEDEAGKAFARRFRHCLLAHFCGVDIATFTATEELVGSVGKTLEALGGDRMQPLGVREPNAFERFVAHWQLGDPHGSDDAWRPWKRRQAAAERISSQSRISGR